MPRVSIVIACRNERDFIRGAVQALAQGTISDIEILVVEGRSTDGTRAVVETLCAADTRIRLLDNPSGITPVAFNIGIRNARAENIAILGAHSIPAADWVERSLAALDEHPECVAVGGILKTVGHTRMGQVIAAVMSSRFGVGNVQFRTGTASKYVDTVVFGLYRRRAFRHGLFDEQLATNQDDELNTRLLARGERLWQDARIHCTYFCRPTWTALLRQYWRYGRYKFLVFRKAGRIGSLRQCVPPLWAAFVLCGLPFLRYTKLVFLAYVLLGLTAACARMGSLGFRTVLFVPIAASLHLAYGVGFWAGLLAYPREAAA